MEIFFSEINENNSLKSIQTDGADGATERKKHFIESIIDQGKTAQAQCAVPSHTANWMSHQLKAHYNHPIDVQIAAS